ncbi:helix-turn-helix domain-containing protein [Psychrobacter arenosus]|uniref:helix-turn-helix domain-containing protein n=1 Tax=Psychrobacter arenosus TaxID=256326 RepID=UPI00191ABE66|nr:helix-turn-helix domain-containing protein [Psychrobacter arenosus]
MRQTQAQTIKAHLMTGATITTLQAVNLYNILYLTTRISELRLAGLPVQSESISRNGKTFNAYWLDRDYIKAQGGDDE